MSDWAYSPSGLLVISGPASRRHRYDKPVGVDLFAGAGGFSLGMHEGGVHVAAAVEYDPVAAMTYMVNLARPGVQIHFDTDERGEKFAKVVEKHLGLQEKGKHGKAIPGASLAGDGWISKQPASVRGCEHFWVADARNMTGTEILGALGLERGEVDIVFGGPPCQGYSMANSKRSVMDPRNSLVFEFARIIVEIRPKTLVMENVPQVATMLTPEGVPVIDAFARILADGGFSTYKAMKAGLEQQAQAFGLMRKDNVKPGKDKEPEGDGPEDEQLDLFGMDGAA